MTGPQVNLPTGAGRVGESWEIAPESPSLRHEGHDLHILAHVATQPL
jgi:hypothetical protein